MSKEAVSNNVGTSGRKEIPSQERAIKWFEEEFCAWRLIPRLETNEREFERGSRFIFWLISLLILVPETVSKCQDKYKISVVEKRIYLKRTRIRL